MLLAEQYSFLLSNSSYSPSKLSLFSSASNNLVAVVTNRTHIAVFSVPEALKLVQATAANVLEVIFSVDDSFLLVNDLFSIKNYSLSSKAWGKDIVAQQKDRNKIESMELSPDYTTLLFLNYSTLYSINLYTLSSSSFPIKSPCGGKMHMVNQKEVLLTSTYDCTICSFGCSQQQIVFKGQITLSQCRYRQMVAVGQKIFLVQDAIMDSIPEVTTLDLDTLQPVQTIRINATQFPLAIATYQNYALIVPALGSSVWILSNNEDHFPNKIDLNDTKIEASHQLFLRKQLLLATSSSDSSLLFLRSFALQRACSQTQTNASCSCKSGQTFQLSSGKCVRRDCSHENCKCPTFFALDPFSLQCKIDCSKIFGSAPVPSYGSPQKCFCRPPFSWNPQIGDCSKLDCSYINHSSTKEIQTICECKERYKWNSSNYDCVLETVPLIQESSSSHAGLIVTAVLVFLVLVILAIIFLYRKYRHQTEDQNGPYVPYNMKKALQQLPTHRQLDEQNIQNHNRQKQSNSPLKRRKKNKN